MFERFLLGLILIYFMILLILCKFRLLMAAMLENCHNGLHHVSWTKFLLKMDLAWFELHMYQISCFYLVCKSSSNGYSYTRGRRFMLRLKLDQDLLISWYGYYMIAQINPWQLSDAHFAYYCQHTPSTPCILETIGEWFAYKIETWNLVRMLFKPCQIHF